jgi:hypothetical protein
VQFDQHHGKAYFPASQLFSGRGNQSTKTNTFKKKVWRADISRREGYLQKEMIESQIRWISKPEKEEEKRKKKALSVQGMTEFEMRYKEILGGACHHPGEIDISMPGKMPGSRIDYWEHESRVENKGREKARGEGAAIGDPWQMHKGYTWRDLSDRKLSLSSRPGCTKIPPTPPTRRSSADDRRLGIVFSDDHSHARIESPNTSIYEKE